MALDVLKAGAAIPRKYLAHFINATPDAETASWVRLGDDLEEYKDEYSADVDKKKNILGETKVKVKDYEVSGSVDPYYAVMGEPLFAWLENIARKRLVLDACKTQILTVRLWDGATGTYVADEEEVVVEIKSVGGDTSGVAIPFDIHHTNKITTGKYNETTKTFTADTAASGSGS